MTRRGHRVGTAGQRCNNGYLWHQQSLSGRGKSANPVAESEPILDAAAQMLSLCLLWRRRGDRLTTHKLAKLKEIWKKQNRSATPSNGNLEISSSLVAQVLEVWERESHDAMTNGSQVAAVPIQLAETLTRHILQLTEEVTTSIPVGYLATGTLWHWLRPSNYLAFIEDQTAALQNRELHQKPLQYVMSGNFQHIFRPGGLWLEFGVSEGGSIAYMARKMDESPKAIDAVAGKIFGFDCFTGLPDDWRPGFESGHFRREEGALPTFDDGIRDRIRLVPGMFQDTLPGFLRSIDAQNQTIQTELARCVDNALSTECDDTTSVAFLHIDCDLYSSTSFVLKELITNSSTSRICPGTVIVFDELLNYAGFETGEMLALYEAVVKFGLEFEWIGCLQRGCMQAGLVVTRVKGESGGVIAD